MKCYQADYCETDKLIIWKWSYYFILFWYSLLYKMHFVLPNGTVWFVALVVINNVKMNMTKDMKVGVNPQKQMWGA